MQPNQPIQPINYSLYPTRDSLEEAFRFTLAELNAVDPQKVIPVLMSYHNTLVQELTKKEHGQAF